MLCSYRLNHQHTSLQSNLRSKKKRFEFIFLRQQQQLERVKKWLQLRNRDNDHRSQVEERRRKRDEEAKVKKIFQIKIFILFALKAKIDELLRREKEREQRVNHTKINVPHKPDIVMSMSTDLPPTRRAISASRLRSNHQGN